MANSNSDIREDLGPAGEIPRLVERPLDVLVIGGGIVGAGVARDAALRGLRVGLVEQHDFASGTSSRSSRLLHGGIRYLAQGRIRLVWEASREKTVIGRIAPHLAEPLPFIFPTRRGSSWSWWKLSLGVKLYDLLCGLKNFGRSSSLSAAEVLGLLPSLNARGLTGGVRYFDALTNDARLVIDTLASASRAGAIFCNYARLVDAAPDGDAWRCEVMDDRTSAAHIIHSRSVVNAAGPWSDRIPNSKTSLRLTKGVHLVIDRARLPVPAAVVMPQGDRILFAIPWGERVILGTTDTDYDGPLDNPSCDPEDVEYVLGVVNDSFPETAIGAADVVSVWSGLRPLVADRHGEPSDISRRHEITMSHPGWWDVTGGKLTTYRLMAEETVDQIVRRLGLTARPCSTATVPLAHPTNTAVVGVTPPSISQTIVEHFCRCEWAYHLDDVMIRRSNWRHYYRDHVALARDVAQGMAETLSWSGARLQEELDRYDMLCQTTVASR